VVRLKPMFALVGRHAALTCAGEGGGNFRKKKAGERGRRTGPFAPSLSGAANGRRGRKKRLGRKKGGGGMEEEEVVMNDGVTMAPAMIGKKRRRHLVGEKRDHIGRSSFSFSVARRGGPKREGRRGGERVAGVADAWFSTTSTENGTLDRPGGEKKGKGKKRKKKKTEPAPTQSFLPCPTAMGPLSAESDRKKKKCF